MANRISNPAVQHFDKSSNAPLAGGQMFFFEPNASTTPKDTFNDSEETTANTNPVILDANGFEPDIFGVGSYRIVLDNADGVQQWERDPVDFEAGTTGFSDWLGSVTYGIGDIVKGSDGNFYISLDAPNTNNDPTLPASSAFWTQFDLLNRWNTDENYVIDDVVRSTTSGSIYTSVINQIGNDPDTDDGTNWKFIDNVRITGNTVTVDDTDGDLNVDPNGTGDLLTGGEVVGLAEITQQFFDATGADTWTKPANVRFIVLEMIGGGAGGGASGTTPNRGGGGGGSGGYIREIIDVTAIASSALVVGDGGITDDNGDDTTFAITTAIGGGGSPGTAGNLFGTGGNGGNASGGGSTTMLVQGGDGASGSVSDVHSGNGGAGYFGGGGKGRNNDAAGDNGVVKGSGGGGGATTDAVSSNGGAGAPGYIIVNEYR